MSKSAFDKIAAGMQAAIDYVDGDREGFVTHIPEEVDLKGIRNSLGLSQPKFAEAFGFTVGRVRDWEQKRFTIDAPSRVLLTVIQREPAAVLRALGKDEHFMVMVHAKRSDAVHAAGAISRSKATRSPAKIGKASQAKISG